LFLVECGIRSTFHEQNASAFRPLLADAQAGEKLAAELLFDPQTSGGLLMALPPEVSDAALEALHDAGDDQAAVIGEILAPADDALLVSLDHGA